LISWIYSTIFFRAESLVGIAAAGVKMEDIASGEIESEKPATVVRRYIWKLYPNSAQADQLHACSQRSPTEEEAMLIRG